MTREQFKKEFGIIGNTAEINDLVDIVMQVAKSDISVFIYGESGVGKEVIAQAIHGYSSRADKQLVTVNCGAIPEGILESELFGHKKGSFTGAIETRKGYFEIADGGTLFLDEIAEMPLTTQVKLLRVIETKEFMRLGAETVTNVDVRIIAATNKDLQREVETGRFREDLYFRLKAVTLNIPPLRKRRADIADLANYFINTFAASNKRKSPLLTNEAIKILENYTWPGNIRELKNTLETAVALNKSGVLDESIFTALYSQPEADISSRNLPVYLKRSPEEVDRELMYRALFEIKKDLIELKDLIYSRQNEIYSDYQKNPKEVIPLEELEKEAIKNALDVTRGSKRNAAKLLKISERTLYRKIKEYGLQ
ncbi:MAG: sigma-54-dependent Fis family transcriptional regulator [Ignavibacteriales bacterium]|nr:MAG: sigma-54-dependent Fis family transcriptional regulator [Ignavibacteriales bacterium]